MLVGTVRPALGNQWPGGARFPAAGNGAPLR